MRPDTCTAIQAVGNNHATGNRFRGMIAHVVSPSRHAAPAPSALAQLASTSFSNYHIGVAKLFQAAAAVFGGGKRAIEIVPESNIGDKVANVDSVNGKVKVPIRDNRVAGGSSGMENEDDYLKDLKRVSAAFGGAEPNQDAEELMEVDSNCLEDAATDLIDGCLEGPGRQTALIHDDTTSIKDICDSARPGPSIDCSKIAVRSPVICTPKPTLAQASPIYMRSRECRYAGQLTLAVPGKRPTHWRLPSQSVAFLQLNLTRTLTLSSFRSAARALQELRYEYEASTSPSLRYTACELADRRVFLRHPIEDPQTDGDYPSVSRMNRETCVSPLKRQWIWKGRAVGAPTIEITRPEIVDSATTKNTDQEHTNRREAVASTRPVPSPTPARRTRGRSNAIWVPASSSSTDTPGQPPLSPIPSNPLLDEPAPVLVNDVPPMTTAAQMARKMRGRPTSMSEWLSLFSTGSNPLVDEKIIATAGPLIESALMPPPLSPTSSSSTSSASSLESSPRTPVELKPLPLVNTMKELTQPSNSCRRARCSYTGGKYDLVVAPVIPDELLTEEIGVAC
ncbi:hypothetical protein CTheo_6725 [Ceratobasidium theobromae]|uniref:Uncharacterized protein n=1 Tax=Ceratobasidium theobromae TaxID=1582974 RepID=A0A5N5QE83_9AGAM|nr:hypothetical protein CTheo_6725 [Ceratobasidium theobromae]